MLDALPRQCPEQSKIDFADRGVGERQVMEDAIVRFDTLPVRLLHGTRLVADLGHHFRNPSDGHVAVAADLPSQRLADPFHRTSQLVTLQVSRQLGQKFFRQKSVLPRKSRAAGGAETVTLRGAALRPDRSGPLDQPFTHESDHMLVCRVARNSQARG